MPVPKLFSRRGSQLPGPSTPENDCVVYGVLSIPKSSRSASSSASPSTPERMEEKCPVCLESLAFRMKGEKNPLVPQCGHRLHEACFAAVYGDPEVALRQSRTLTGNHSLGLCGVCRRDMKLGEPNDSPGSGKLSKFASLTGSANTSPLDTHKIRSVSRRTIAQKDPAADDDLVTHFEGLGIRRTSAETLHATEHRPPNLQVSVKAEHPSIARSVDPNKKLHLTCIVTVSLPSRIPSIQTTQPFSPPDPYSFTTSPDLFPGLVQDLTLRMSDWKGHSPTDFGNLRMFDNLLIRKEDNIREFMVYLFDEALLCVTDDKKKSGGSSDKLRMRGRVYTKHMRSIEDTSTPSELSLTISMEDETLAAFILTFKERQLLDLWKSEIENLIAADKTPPAQHYHPPAPKSQSIFSKGSIRSSGSGEPSSTSDTSSQFTRYTKSTATSFPGSPVRSPIQKLQTSLQGNLLLNKTLHPPLDLMLILSLPPASMIPSAAGLKLRLLRQSLECIFATIGPRTRISLVVYSAGDGTRGMLKKIPFTAIGTNEGRSRLDGIVQEIGGIELGILQDAEFKEDKVNVVTAVNLALDIVLQRKAKSALTGMILLNDGKDGAQKHQMDLVMARAEAAQVPIHAFGWGKHDPASLWLLSNHTGGTYTFIKDFYQLRDMLAGCVGSILAIGLHCLTLHLNVPEQRWFKIRKVAGIPNAIVSSDGKDVDIDIGELRYGEKREMLVEVELGMVPSMPSYMADDSSQTSTYLSSDDGHTTTGRKQSLTATDEFFVSKVGMAPSALHGSDEYVNANFYEELEQGMIDEVPVFEINATFKDPLAPSEKTSRLPYPALLTTTITPPLSSQQKALPQPVSDAAIVRRRMELLTSDMITRTLLLMSRRQDQQAQRILQETRRIFSAILLNLNSSPSTSAAENRLAHSVISACEHDMDIIYNGCMNRVEFDTTTRNYAAQQAVVLRDQKSIGARSKTEECYFTVDLAREFVRISESWVSPSD